jgi:hypothetical protein
VVTYGYCGEERSGEHIGFFRNSTVPVPFLYDVVVNSDPDPAPDIGFMIGNYFNW